MLTRYGASNPRLFGSVARGDAGEKSDIDLMVDLPDGPDSKLMQVAGISERLGRLLGVRVDVVTPSLLREQVSQEARKDLLVFTLA